MNRKNQITKDFARLLNDGRLQLANVVQDDIYTRFDIVVQKPLRVKNSDGSFEGHARIDFDHIVSIALKNDYSNFIESVAAVLSRHPYRDKDDTPLMRLRVNTLTGKRHVTLSVTCSGDLEFFGCKNYKVSDDLATALLDEMYHDNAACIKVVSTYSDAEMTHTRYSRQFILKIA